MKEKHVNLLVCLYIILAIGVFGHVTANHECKDKKFSSCAEQKAVHGVMASLFAPLYISWELFDD